MMSVNPVAPKSIIFGENYPSFTPLRNRYNDTRIFDTIPAMTPGAYPDKTRDATKCGTSTSTRTITSAPLMIVLANLVLYLTKQEMVP
jgi:hypothetical protein